MVGYALRANPPYGGWVAALRRAFAGRAAGGAGVAEHRQIDRPRPWTAAPTAAGPRAGRAAAAGAGRRSPGPCSSSTLPRSGCTMTASAGSSADAVAVRNGAIGNGPVGQLLGMLLVVGRRRHESADAWLRRRLGAVASGGARRLARSLAARRGAAAVGSRAACSAARHAPAVSAACRGRRGTRPSAPPAPCAWRAPRARRPW